jgi:tRNA-dihydrouridine synthase A
VAQAGCEVFIVHARNAWLQGISPKENRELPPLRYDTVLRLARDFPSLRFVLNGGVAGDEQIASHLRQLHGVMVGRESYQHPWSMVSWDAAFLGAVTPTEPVRRQDIEAAMVGYMQQMAAQGQPWSHASRHMLGLWNGTPGARRWRQVWSDHRLKDQPPAQVARAAQQARGAELHNNSPVAAP